MFTEDLAVAIVKGQKTATRRVLSDNPRSPWYRNQPAGKRYPVGKVFAVNPGRGVPRVAECEVTARYRQVLGTVDGREAIAEGFKSQLAFRDAWTKINGGFNLREVVDVVEFKLVGSPCPACDGRGEIGPAFVERPCFDCYATGIIVTVPAVALIAKRGREARQGG